MYHLNGHPAGGKTLHILKLGMRMINIDMIIPLSKHSPWPKCVLVIFDDLSRLGLYNYRTNKILASPKDFLLHYGTPLRMKHDPITGQLFCMCQDLATTHMKLICFYMELDDQKQQPIFKQEVLMDFGAHTMSSLYETVVLADIQKRLGFTFFKDQVITFSLQSRKIIHTCQLMLPILPSLIEKFPPWRIMYFGFDENRTDFPYTFLAIGGTEVYALHLNTDFSFFYMTPITLFSFLEKWAVVDSLTISLSTDNPDYLKPESLRTVVIVAWNKESKRSFLYNFTTDVVVELGDTDRKYFHYLSSIQTLFFRENSKLFAFENLHFDKLLVHPTQSKSTLAKSVLLLSSIDVPEASQPEYTSKKSKKKTKEAKSK